MVQENSWNTQIMSESLLEKKSQHLHYYSNTFNKQRETVAKGTDMWQTVQNL